MENTQIPYQQEQNPVQYAGFWWRFLAYLIDQILISVVSGIFVLPILAIFGISVFSMQQSGFNPEDSLFVMAPFFIAVMMMSIASMIFQWLYFALMESSKHQGTLGKLLLKIRVTDTSGNPVSFARATGRYFGKILSGMIIMIGYIMAGFTEKKQALHDILANCYVVKD